MGGIVGARYLFEVGFDLALQLLHLAAQDALVPLATAHAQVFTGQLNHSQPGCASTVGASMGGGTRRVRLVRGEGRDVSG